MFLFIHYFLLFHYLLNNLFCFNFSHLTREMAIVGRMVGGWLIWERGMFWHVWRTSSRFLFRCNTLVSELSFLFLFLILDFLFYFLFTRLHYRKSRKQFQYSLRFAILQWTKRAVYRWYMYVYPHTFTDTCCCLPVSCSEKSMTKKRLWYSYVNTVLLLMAAMVNRLLTSYSNRKFANSMKFQCTSPLRSLFTRTDFAIGTCLCDQTY